MHDPLPEGAVPPVCLCRRRSGQHRVRVCLDEVQQRPGDAVAVVRAEPRDQRFRLFPSRLITLSCPSCRSISSSLVSQPGRGSSAMNASTSGLTAGLHRRAMITSSCEWVSTGPRCCSWFPTIRSGRTQSGPEDPGWCVGPRNASVADPIVEVSDRGSGFRAHSRPRRRRRTGRC